MLYRSSIGAVALAASLGVTSLGATVGGALAFDESKYPDWKGAWRRVAVPGVIGQPSYDPTKRGGQAQEAPLTPEYQAIFEANLKDQAAGGQGTDPTYTCLSPGMPRVMTTFAPFEILVTPQMTNFLIQHIHDSRRIFTDGREWPKKIVPTFVGYSIGRWIDTDGDGRYDLLEIETRGLKGPRSYDPAGLPFHSDNQSIFKERVYSDKADPNILYDEITTIDNALTRPWTVTKTYSRLQIKQPEWVEEVCAEGNGDVEIGKEGYFLSGDGHLMPTKKDQAPPDLRYFKQALTPLTEPPNGDTKSGVSIPDLSGIWGRWFTFEPPSSGPSPVVSKLHRPDGTMILSVVGDYTNPILRPEAAATIKRIGEMELSGTVLPNPHNQCWPEPTPFTLSIQLGMQMIQQKDEVILLYLSDHQVRHVRLNVPHSAHTAPTWQGESVGHYEGDTLVVDTIGQKVGPLSMVDRYGTPFSTALHVIERYRLIDGPMARDLQQKHESVYFGAGRSSPPANPYGRGEIDPDPTKPGLQVEITVDDPATFATPWSALVTYRGVQGTWPEAVCAENTRGSGSSWVSLVPQASKPDF